MIIFLNCNGPSNRFLFSLLILYDSVNWTIWLYRNWITTTILTASIAHPLALHGRSPVASREWYHCLPNMLCSVHLKLSASSASRPLNDTVYLCAFCRRCLCRCRHRRVSVRVWVMVSLRPTLLFYGSMARQTHDWSSDALEMRRPQKWESNIHTFTFSSHIIWRDREIFGAGDDGWNIAREKEDNSYICDHCMCAGVSGEICWQRQK